MVNKIDNHEIEMILGSFGLSTDEQNIYLTLLQQARATPLTLSRATAINRSTLYRILEALSDKGLVEEVMDYKSKSYRAAPPERLNLLLSKKIAETETLREQIPKLSEALKQAIPLPANPTSVLYFKGVQGLRQLLYNTLDAKSEVIGYGYGNWNDGVGKRFAEKLRQEYVDRNIKARELLNMVDISGSFTSVAEYVNGVYHNRSISPKKLLITHDTYIYNDVFAFYHTTNGVLFGVEIHNIEIVKTQKAIFEILWKLAKPLSSPAANT